MNAAPEGTTSARRPRVLLVSHAATLTGAPVVALEVLRALDGACERVTVLRRRGELAGDFRGSSERVLVEPLHRACRFLRHWDRTRPVEAVVACALALLTLLRVRPDVVYLNTSESAGYVRPALWLKKRVILHVHEPRSDATRMLRPHRLGKRYGRVTLVAVSEAARAELADITEQPASAIRLVATSTDPNRVARLAAGGEPTATVVGAVGSVTHRKGTDLWLDVAGRVRDNDPDARFEWLGDLPDRTLRTRVHQLGLDGVVEFVPAVHNPYPRMRSYAVLTVPSREETAGLVVQEAMALGVPVVAFDLPAVAEQLGDAGVLVSAGDTAAMADAVLVLLGDPDLRLAMGGRGRKRAFAMFSLARFHDSVRALVVGESATQ